MFFDDQDIVLLDVKIYSWFVQNRQKNMAKRYKENAMDDIKSELKRSLIDSWWDIEDESTFGRILPRMFNSNDIELIAFHSGKNDDEDRSYSAVFEYLCRDQQFKPYYVLIDITPAHQDAWDLADKFGRTRMMQDAVDRAMIVADIGSLNVLMMGFGCHMD
jgi:hypothetical protein